MATKQLNIQINQKGAKKATNETRRLGESVAGTIGKYVALGTVLHGMKAYFVNNLKLYAQQELAEKKLQAALGYTSKSLLKYAAHLQTVSVYGDERILEAQALIASFIKEEGAIKAATKATLDLAAAKGMDLVSAADLISKTLGSSTNALSRYGIQVDGAVGSTKRLTSLTENIAKLFGGQAAAQTETLTGKVSQLSNAWSDLGEQSGEMLVKTLPVTESVSHLTKVIGGFNSLVDAGDEKLKAYSGGGLKSVLRRLVMMKEAFGLATLGLNSLNEATIEQATVTFNSSMLLTEHGKKVKEQEAAAREAAAAYAEWRGKKLEKIKKDEQEAVWMQKLNQELIIQAGLLNKGFVAGIADRINVSIKEPLEVALIKVPEKGISAIDLWVQESNARMMTFSSITQDLIGSAFTAAFSQGENALESFKNAFLRILSQLAVKAATFGILSAIFPGASIGFGSFMFGKGFAEGGVIPEPIVGVGLNSGQGYTFGEEGPETVIPNGGAAGVTINFNGNITDRAYVQNFLIPEINRAVRLGRA